MNRIEREIQEALRPGNWEIVARLSSDRYDDPSEILDRLARAIEQRFTETTTMMEADYPTHRLLAKTNDKLSVIKFADDWLYDQAPPGKKTKARPPTKSRARSSRAARISETKPSHVTTPDLWIRTQDGSVYRLEPAASRTHYGQHRLDSGGVPYAYATKKADGAWFVVSGWNHKTLGVLEKHDDDWSFAKVKDRSPAPSWLRSAMDGSTSPEIYNLSHRLHSGGSPAEAIAAGLASRS